MNENTSSEIKDAFGIAYVKVKTWQTTYRGTYPDAKLDEMQVGEHAEKWENNIRFNKNFSII